MHSILNEIIAEKKKTVETSKAELPLEEIRKILGTSYKPRDFRKAVGGAGKIKIIAEIKKASPSAGVILADFDPAVIAREYEKGGASAISVLTEEKYFQGKPSYIAVVRKNCGLPVLRKDFIVDRYQVAESAYLGADALLLIAAALEKQELKNMVSEARSIGIECLVEIHDENDLEKAVDADAGIIGINNRNLDDFSVDLKTSERIIPKIPAGKLIIIESGIKTKDDIKRYSLSGVRAFLIGESVMRSGDRASAVKELMR
ncbi:MAG: indole-3-glycerol phosphate synthase TrpC [Elusimicrobiota bacterium]